MLSKFKREMVFWRKGVNFVLNIKKNKMILSMTGYGKAETIVNNKKIHVEIKSLNSKNIDISTHLSSIFQSKDLEIRTYLIQILIRGKIDLYVWAEDLSSLQNTTLSEDVIHSYIEQIKNISIKEQILAPKDNWWDVLSKLPGITQQPSWVELTDDLWMSVKETISKATKHLIDFRRQEGIAVQAKFVNKLENIDAYLQDIAKYETLRIEKIKQNIMEGLKSLRNVEYDQNRLEQEMIYYIEKLDISEEKQRLKNHLEYFSQTMNLEENQGKKMGFIAQEIGREINTMGSKSNNADMQNLVVKMKDELEQIKEQVLNVL